MLNAVHRVSPHQLSNGDLERVREFKKYIEIYFTNTILFLNFETICCICIFIAEGGIEIINADSSAVVRVSSTGTLEISKVKDTMKGFYTCEADNGFGKPLLKVIELAVNGE